MTLSINNPHNVMTIKINDNICLPVLVLFNIFKKHNVVNNIDSNTMMVHNQLEVISKR